MAKIVSKKRIAVVFVVMASATFGPIIFGALGSLFWTEHSEYSEKQTRVNLLVDRSDRMISYFRPAHELPEWGLLHDRNYLGECETRALGYSSFAVTPEENHTLFNLGSSAHAQTASLVLRAEQKQRIRRLPRVVVGALDACIGSTIISPLCRSFVQSRISPLDDETIEGLRTEIREQTEQDWCLISAEMQENYEQYLRESSAPGEIVEIPEFQFEYVP